jgi:hypothetical protein
VAANSARAAVTVTPAAHPSRPPHAAASEVTVS